MSASQSFAPLRPLLLAMAATCFSFTSAHASALLPPSVLDGAGAAPLLSAPPMPAAAASPAASGPFHFGSIHQFIYSPNDVFEIRARVGSFVNIEVPRGETIEGLYLSDTTLWRFVVAADHSRVMIKPGRAGLSNSGTLVTNRRVYEISLLSVEAGQPWHQRVQWNPDQPQQQAWGIFAPAFDSFTQPQSQARVGQAAAAAPAAAVAPTDEIMVDAARVSFNWSIEGEARFRPISVFDDGRFTYIRMPVVQDLPALFAQDDGQMRIVDYAVRGDTLIVSRVSDSFVLRLGDQSVRVIRHGGRP